MQIAFNDDDDDVGADFQFPFKMYRNVGTSYRAIITLHCIINYERGCVANELLCIQLNSLYWKIQ